MPKPLYQCRVLVTATSYGVHDPALKTTLESQVGEVVYNQSGRPFTAEELAALIPGFDACIAGLDRFDRQVIARADHLRVIARYGTGVDNIDLDAAREKGIIITNTPAANADSVAELTIGLILALARNIVVADRETRAGLWPRLQGISVNGKTVGLIGFGAIGRRVAQKLSGLGCQILAFDPYTDPASGEGLAHFTSREEVIASADFLSLHCPLTGQTRGMVDAAFLKSMKRGAFLINTARGELIDEAALIAALNEGHLRGAALDVFTRQPPGADHPLLAMPQVIVTPHMGAHSDHAANAMGWGALNNCLAVLRGEEPENRVV
ncbi:MAG TPA: hypothetical protein DEQ80_01665 [Anaerolinea thermolimosa]|uniref:D-3-phosphoglycerate dehydrogenase n=1 Tax=Anaerolinea thermolimosa TaxID=229919 RepID=A0A3D1JDN9_9CHLR|nr:hypothetical protein [Anaerolinea thermolimosa]